MQRHHCSPQVKRPRHGLRHFRIDGQGVGFAGPNYRPILLLLRPRAVVRRYAVLHHARRRAHNASFQISATR